MTPTQGQQYLAELPDNEPVFVLRGRDLFAPAAVTAWAAMCLSQNETDKDGEPLHPGTLAKGRRAMQLAQEMRRYQEQQGGKTPD